MQHGDRARLIRQVMRGGWSIASAWRFLETLRTLQQDGLAIEDRWLAFALREAAEGRSYQCDLKYEAEECDGELLEHVYALVPLVDRRDQPPSARRRGGLIEECVADDDLECLMHVQYAASDSLQHDRSAPPEMLALALLVAEPEPQQMPGPDPDMPPPLHLVDVSDVLAAPRPGPAALAA